MHDNNGGILASGLFWVVPLDKRAVRVSRDARRAVLRARDVPVIDSFQFLGQNQIPASVSFHVEWRATDEFVERGSGTDVPPTDPAAFQARFAVATSIASFEGSEFGFGFRSDPGASSDRGFAEMGRERNGAFLT